MRFCHFLIRSVPTEARAWGHVGLKCRKCVITVLTEPAFDGPPKILNKVEFTVKFWEDDAEVPCRLNYLLNKRFLTFEIRL
jgi:hypothetical protein